VEGNEKDCAGVRKKEHKKEEKKEKNKQDHNGRDGWNVRRFRLFVCTV
jgi:hypothetical protein